MKVILIILMIFFLISCESLNERSSYVSPPRIKLNIPKNLNPRQISNIPLTDIKRYTPVIEDWKMTDDVIESLSYNEGAGSSLTVQAMEIRRFTRNDLSSLGIVNSKNQLILAPPVNDIKSISSNRLYFQRVKDGPYYFLNAKKGDLVELPFKRMKRMNDLPDRSKWNRPAYGFDCTQTCTAYIMVLDSVTEDYRLLKIDNVSPYRMDESYLNGAYPIDITTIENKNWLDKTFYVVRHRNNGKDYIQLYSHLDGHAKGLPIYDFAKILPFDLYAEKVNDGLYMPLFFPKSSFLGLEIKPEANIYDEVYLQEIALPAKINTSAGLRTALIKRDERSLPYLVTESFSPPSQSYLLTEWEILNENYVACRRSEGGQWMLNDPDYGASGFMCVSTLTAAPKPDLLVPKYKKESAERKAKAKAQERWDAEYRNQKAIEWQTYQSNLENRRNSSAQDYVTWALYQNRRELSLDELQRAHNLATNSGEKNTLWSRILHLNNRGYNSSRETGPSLSDTAIRNYDNMQNKNFQDWLDGKIKNQHIMVPK